MSQLITYVTTYIVPLLPIVFPLVMLSQALLSLLGLLLKRRKLSIHPAGAIEIGLNQYGPTITLFGTFRAQHAEIFINNITLTLTNPATNLTRTLEWRAFKPYTFSMVPEIEALLELATALQVNPSKPFKYGIMFMDEGFLRAHMPTVRIIQTAWANRDISGSNTPDQPAQIQAFLATPAMQPHVAALQQSNYWGPGTYTLTMQVETAHTKRLHTQTCRFTLTPEHSQTLAQNVGNVLYFICGQPSMCQQINVAYQAG